MTKELKMIQIILENGEVRFWNKVRCEMVAYHTFEHKANGVIFKGEMQTHVNNLELEEPKTVYKQFMHALFNVDENLDTYERLTKIKELVKQHEDFLREK